MNKTVILSFILDKVVLKCRNVSRNLRKRIHWMLTLKEIKVKKYDEKALVLNGWVTIAAANLVNKKLEEIEKGVSNYYLINQKQFERVMAFSNEVRCAGLKFNPTYPIEVEVVNDITIDPETYNTYLNYSFNKAQFVSTWDLSTDEIKFILTRFKRIDKLHICNCFLDSIDFTHSRITKFGFKGVLFDEPVYLPNEIEELTVENSQSLNMIKVQRVNAINFCDYSLVSLEEYEELVKTLKGVKIVSIDWTLTECLTSLPPTVREISIPGSKYKANNLKEVVKRLPYLVNLNRKIPIEILNTSNLRMIEPIMPETKEKFNIRPRKIKVNTNNACQLNNHPELFEKVESVDISSNKFNFDALFSEIKRINIRSEVDEDGATLNRLKKER